MVAALAQIPTLDQLMIPNELAKFVLQLAGGDVSGVEGLRVVRAASTANIADRTAMSTSFDGLTLVAGDRILLKDQSTHSQNGIYVVGTVATGTAPITRAPDMDDALDVQSGMVVAVSAGSAGANTLWLMTTTGWPGSKVLGTDTLDFGAFTGAALSSSTPAAIGAAAAGTSGNGSKSDHVHAITCLPVSWNKEAVDGAAGTATAEHVFHRARVGETVAAIKFLPDGALTAHDTNYASIIVRKRDGAGGAAAILATLTTKITGGSGNWSAFVYVDFGAIANATLTAGDVLTVEITKNAGGVVVQPGRLFVDLST